MQSEKSKYSTAFKLALLFITGVIIMLALSSLIKARSVSAPVPAAAGILQVEVVDGASEAPLKDAVIMIPELDRSFTTDSDGKASMELPILSDADMKKVLPQPWGEVTLIVTREGYIPYVLFHTQVWPGEIRPGPKVYMFSEGANTQPFSVVEAPQRAWVNELVKKYAPKP